jgi:FMN-dependent NADH-azoreductase
MQSHHPVHLNHESEFFVKLLHIDSSILGQGSTSRQLSAKIVEKFKAPDSSISVTYRDLAANPIPHLSSTTFAAIANSAIQTGNVKQPDIELSEEVLAEFLDAEIIIIGVAFYNFTVPTQLKAWVDRIVINGKTFRYTETGPQGLAGGKKVVLAVARGGFYGAGSPAASWEHAETYLRTILGFLGVTDIEVVVAEGLSVGPTQREQALAAASRQIAELSV